MRQKILALSIAGVLASTGVALAEPMMMGYYSNWDTYAGYPFPGNAQGAVNDDLGYKMARVNTLAYDFFEVDSNGYVYFSDPWSDLVATDAFCLTPPVGSPLDSNPLNLGKNLTCTDVADKNNEAFASAVGLGNFDTGFIHSGVPNLMISIGGAGHDDSWQNAMNNPSNFVNSVAALVKAYNLQGVDVDYEPVGGMPVGNYQPFINLMTQLRTALGSSALITYTIPANPVAINAFGKDNWAAVIKVVSTVNIMGYDLHGEFDNPQKTGLHSSLYPVVGDPTQFSDDSAVQALGAVGVPASKIVLGFPAYGRAVGGVATAGVNQPFTQAYKGDIDPSGCSTVLGSANVCPGMVQYSTLATNGLQQVSYNVGGVTADIYSNDLSKGLFVSYDNETSVAAKADYVEANGLAGMMVWELRYDAPAVNAGVPNQVSLLNSADGVLGIPARPYTPSALSTQLQLTNTGSVSSAGLVVSLSTSMGGPAYIFPAVAGASSISWCSKAAASASCQDSGNLDTLIQAGQTVVYVQVNSSAGSTPIQCGTIDLRKPYNQVMSYAGSNCQLSQ